MENPGKTHGFPGDVSLLRVGEQGIRRHGRTAAPARGLTVRRPGPGVDSEAQKTGQKSKDDVTPYALYIYMYVCCILHRL